MKCKCFGMLAVLLTIIGALNWGLWGFFQFDFVAWICEGNTNWASRIIYSIIGLAGLFSIRYLFRCKSKTCSCCKGEKGSCSTGDKDKGGGCCR